MENELPIQYIDLWESLRVLGEFLESMTLTSDNELELVYRVPPGLLSGEGLYWETMKVYFSRFEIQYNRTPIYSIYFLSSPEFVLDSITYTIRLNKTTTGWLKRKFENRLTE